MKIEGRTSEMRVILLIIFTAFAAVYYPSGGLEALKANYLVAGLIITRADS